MSKGTLELCVLSLLTRKDMYGYEIVSAISQEVEITEGAVYPLLKRLREEALVNSYLAESQEGPPRKYYAITPTGRDACVRLSDEWQLYVERIKRLCGC
jgi:PadR family transcriptional regulator PadR